MTETAVSRERIGNLVITPRPLADYRDMFLLNEPAKPPGGSGGRPPVDVTDELLAGPILDCPGGASPFGAQVRRRGGRVTSVDPAYELSHAELSRRITDDLAHIWGWTNANLGNFDWTYLGSPSSLVKMFEVSAELFLADYSPNGERYVAARLPDLPFADGTFRLALSSHLLFCYPEYLDYDQHLAGVLELMRVTTDELRIYPIVDTAGAEFPRLAELRGELADKGITTEIRTSNAAYVAGGERMLSCRWR